MNSNYVLYYCNNTRHFLRNIKIGHTNSDLSFDFCSKLAEIEQVKQICRTLTDLRESIKSYVECWGPRHNVVGPTVHDVIMNLWK